MGIKSAVNLAVGGTGALYLGSKYYNHGKDEDHPHRALERFIEGKLKDGLKSAGDKLSSIDYKAMAQKALPLIKSKIEDGVEGVQNIDYQAILDKYRPQVEK